MEKMKIKLMVKKCYRNIKMCAVFNKSTFRWKQTDFHRKKYHGPENFLQRLSIHMTDPATPDFRYTTKRPTALKKDAKTDYFCQPCQWTASNWKDFLAHLNTECHSLMEAAAYAKLKANN